MSFYYSNTPDNQQSYAEFDPQNIPYPPPVNYPPPAFNSALFQNPPPGHFYVPNLGASNFPAQPSVAQGVQGIHFVSPETEINMNHYDNQVTHGRKQQRPQSGRGQGYRRGSAQGHRGGHNYVYERGYDQGYERYQGQRYGRGQGYSRNQKGEIHGSGQEVGQSHKKNECGRWKGIDNRDREANTAPRKTPEGRGKCQSAEVTRISYQGETDKENEETERSNNNEESLTDKKSKTYASDQDFLEKNFAAFSSKTAKNSKTVECERKGQEGSRVYSAKPVNQKSVQYQNQPGEFRKSQKGNRNSSDPRRSRYNSDTKENWQSEDGREGRQYQNKRENRQKYSPRDYANPSESGAKTYNHYRDYGSEKSRSSAKMRREYTTTEKDCKNIDKENAVTVKGNEKSSMTGSSNKMPVSDFMSEIVEESSKHKGSEVMGEQSGQDTMRNRYQDDREGKRREKDMSLQYKQTRKQDHQYRRGQRRPAVVRTASGKVDESQRALLIEQLTMGTYECMVCCETVRGLNAVWSCNGCYHVFHLRCIKTWARSPTARVEASECGWRCPACQNTADKVPNQYRCFCGKVRDPEWNRMETPHSCGEVCKKIRSANCKHHCNILCHPGPCPPCTAVVSRSCLCGKTSQSVKCSSVEILKCADVCERQRNCGKHFCKAVCHDGPCDPCQEVIKQECYGNHETREVTCGSSESFTESFGCGHTCARELNCGNHKCTEICHEGPCQPCRLLPEAITTCPCGARELSELSPTPRQSCLDPIPNCGGRCRKPLKCGPPKKPHLCERKCHEGECGSCDLTTELTCRCTKFKKEFPCTEVMKLQDRVFLCERKCNKLRSCQRHKCGQHCCVLEEHTCSLICGKKLPCGLHRCDEPCHRGNCPPCLMASFDELSCHCGIEIMYPPIPCGAKPPECMQLCTRMHACDHQVQHRCHSDESCPPCTALTEKWCMGKHEMRKNIACHRDNISCGLPCNKVLPCQQHKCTKVCHSGPCQTEKEYCKQPCQLKRATCDHVCANPCHHGNSCPANPCKAEVKIRCSCGNREAKVSCQSLDNKDFKSSLPMQSLATSLGAGQSVDISHLTSQKKVRKQPVLECDADCALIERNRRLALALEIKNPDLQAKLGSPSYSDFLKDFAKKNLHFVAGVEKNFNDMVQNAKKAKQAYRSHSFPSMNRDQRRLIHELSECYGCETQSYDYEPNKNVVATAYKDKCWLPNVTLTSYVQREMHPKAPPPIPHRHSETEIRETAQAAKQSFEVLKDKPIERLQRSSNTKDTEKTTKVIDYFDFSTK